MRTTYCFEVQFRDDPVRQYHCCWVAVDCDREALEQAEIMIENEPSICFMRVYANENRILREGVVA
jgi:hypothetical protein